MQPFYKYKVLVILELNSNNKLSCYNSKNVLLTH